MLTAADLGDQVASSAADYLATERPSSAGRWNGLYRARRCQGPEPGARHMIGPNPCGSIDRENSTQPDFEYSAATRAVRSHRTPPAPDARLAAPARFLPGRGVSFAGVGDAGDCADPIACLLGATSGP